MRESHRGTGRSESQTGTGIRVTDRTGRSESHRQGQVDQSHRQGQVDQRVT